VKVLRLNVALLGFSLISLFAVPGEAAFHQDSWVSVPVLGSLEHKQAKEARAKEAQDAANAIHPITYLSVEHQDEYEPMGDYTRVMSKSRTGRKFVRVDNLSNNNYKVGDTVWM